MAITFLEQKRKQKQMLFVFALLGGATLLVFWFGFFSKLGKQSAGVKEGDIIGSPAMNLPEVEIEWGVLSDKKIEKIQPFEGREEFNGLVGRENPFMPY